MTETTTVNHRNSGLIEPATIDEAIDALTNIWASGGSTIVVDHVGPDVLRSNAVPVSLRGLDQIVCLDRDSSAIVVQAGVTVGAVKSAASTFDLWCPALRWLPESVTLGAAVAGNHGRRGRRYGAVADYLLGTRYLCPSVGLVRHGGKAIKNASGYNLTSTVVGTRGALGVVLEIILRLVPVPAHRSVLRFTVECGDDAWLIARDLARAGLTADAVEAEQNFADAHARVLVEIEDVALESLEARSDRIASRAGEHGVKPDDNPSWPPRSSGSSWKTWRAAITPTSLPDAGAALAAAARQAELSGWVLAEATGGGVELATESAIVASELAPSVFGHLAGSTVADQFAATLRSAFDPDHRLVTG